MDGKSEMFFKNMWRQIPQFYREYKKVLLWGALLYGIEIYFLIYQWIYINEYTGLITSAGDCYILMGSVSRRMIADIPIFSVLTVILVRNKNNLQYLMGWRKRKYIWLEQLMETAAYAVFLSIFETILIGAYGWMLTGRSLNWEEQGSVFWKMTGKTYGHGALWKVIFCFWAASVALYLFTGSVVLFFEWLSGSLCMGIFLCMGLAAAENYTSLQVIFGKADLYYERWLLGSNGTDILCVVAVIVILILSGMYTAQRKEFYGKRD